MKQTLARACEYAAAAAIIVMFSGTILLFVLFGVDLKDGVSAIATREIRLSYIGIYAVELALLSLSPFLVLARWRDERLLIAFLLLLAFSMLWSVDPGASFRGWVSLMMTTLLGAYLVGRQGVTRGPVLVLAVLGGLMLLSVALVFAAPAVAVHSDAHAGAWRGVFGHKNVAGNILVWMFPLTLYAQARRVIGWKIAGLVLAAALGFLIMTHSKTSLVVALAAMGFWGVAWLVRRDVRVVALLAIILAVAIGAAGFLLLFAPDMAAALLGRDATFTGRVFIWQELTRLIAARPALGYGYSAIWDMDYGPLYRFIEDWGIIAGHNAYLDLTLDAGFIGLGLFLLLLCNVLRKAVVALRYGDWPLGALALTSVMVIAMESLSESIVPSGHKLHWVMLSTVAFAIGGHYRALHLPSAAWSRA